MKAKEYLDQEFNKRYKKNFKSWMLDKFIDDLTKISDFNPLTEANVEEVKLLLEIYERD